MYQAFLPEVTYLTEKVWDQEWAVKVGKVRVMKIKEQYEKLGYIVIANAENHEGADLIIVSVPSGRIRKAIEVTNYRDPNFHMSNERVGRYIKTLKQFDKIEGIELELVVSFLNNLSASQLVEVEKASIHVIVAGEQDLLDEDQDG
jgi:hypothetical protein